ARLRSGARSRGSARDATRSDAEASLSSAPAQSADEHAWKHEQAIHISPRKTARIECHAPQPLAADGLQDTRRPPLVARKEIEAGTDADERDAVRRLSAAVREDLLLGCA